VSVQPSGEIVVFGGDDSTRPSSGGAGTSAETASASGSADALGELCRTYWYPIYAFVRRQGRNHEAAQDLTQAFFARMLEKRYIDEVGPEKGKFRTFLLVCLKRFLANEWDKETASHKLGPAFRNSWFGQALLPRITFGPIDETTAITVLAEACSAPRAARPKSARLQATGRN